MNRNIFFALLAILFIYFSGVFISSEYHESYTKTIYGPSKGRGEYAGFIFYDNPIGQKVIPASYDFEWNPVQWDIAGKVIFAITILVVLVLMAIGLLNEEPEDADDPEVLLD